MPIVRAAICSFPILVWLSAAAAPEAAAQRRDPLREMRLRMVEQYLVREGITNRRVLEAMRTVPRHEFVRPNQRAMAYLDVALPIGFKQTISPPFIVAYMTEVLDPQPNEKVLEIGTGSGYQAAVLSGLCKEVYTIEIVEELGRAAERRLKRLRYDNVHVKIGDGYKGWPEHAPFDKIIVTCSPEDVPQPLVDQLKDGGRMIIPLGQRYQQVFHLLEKKGRRLQRQQLIPTLFVPMTGISEEQRTVKPDPRNPQIVNGGFEADQNNDGSVDNWHYQRQTKLIEGKAPQGKRHLCLENNEPGRPAQLLQGAAVDGRTVGRLEFNLWVSYSEARGGRGRDQQPALVVHFYDSTRRPIGERVVGTWTGSSGGWLQIRREVKVPAEAREMVLRIGLNGATGRLCVDDLRMTPKRR